MSAKHLSKVGSDLVRRCGTRDPFRIAQELGIEVLFCEDFGPLKGMYRVIKRNRFIFINKDLSSRMQRIVCAHELGHDQLHRLPCQRKRIAGVHALRHGYEAGVRGKHCCCGNPS